MSPIHPFESYYNEANEQGRHKILHDNFLIQFIHSLPYTTAILDHKRRVIIANKIQIDRERAITVEEFFGQPTGALLNCIHANNPYGSCLNEGVCKFCGVPNAILMAEQKGKKVIQETSVTLRREKEQDRVFEVELHASPFRYADQQLILLTIIDISEQKRKRVLERIFFHDILNKTGSLQGAMELLNREEDPEVKSELQHTAQDVIKDLNEEILQHKKLMAAESGDLELDIEELNSQEIVHESVTQIKHFKKSYNYQSELKTACQNFYFFSDAVILKRILKKKKKNALEASFSDETITIGGEIKENKVYFWVHNQVHIPEEHQMRIFERTFSTKGKNRGLGTYSMKLLGEIYLGGQVSYHTHQTSGTTFTIVLPVHPE